MSVKEAAHAAIDTLPEEATLQDAADRLALLAALEKGRHAVKEGREVNELVACVDEVKIQ